MFAWEQRKLGEGTLKIGDGLHGTPKYSTSGNVLFINGNNLINGKVVITSETKRVTSNEQSKDDKELNQNTILMSINGTIGSLAWYRNENLMLGKSVAYIEVSEFDKKFVYAYLQTTKVKFYFISSLTGTTIKNLGLKAIRETPLLIPNIEEQEKIGEFFQQLDSLIALHQRKLEHLQEQKKVLLQKMFPKNGETVPEVRFPGFTDAWEQRRFKDISKLSQGLQIAISKRFTHPGDGKLFYITNEFLNPNSTVKYYIDSPTKNVIAGKTDILMTRTGNTGKVVTDVEGVYHNNFFKISYNSSKIDRWFLYYLLNSYPIQREILVRAGNSTIPDLNHNDFYGIKIYIPTIEEQIKVGTFLTKMDSLITLHQRKLEHLELMKKGLLQQMFV